MNAIEELIQTLTRHKTTDFDLNNIDLNLDGIKLEYENMIEEIKTLKEVIEDWKDWALERGKYDD